ncbi:MAG: PAS domain S-box protein [Anaerolineae bacterium]|nr:PAS domain S-box protein [Anaerolineae bacterium]
MQRTVEQTQGLYEIALSIGTSLDLHPMLKTSLSTILEKFNCSAGGIHFWRDGLGSKPIYSIPRNAASLTTYQTALTTLTDKIKETPTLESTFPLQKHSSQGSHSYIFELPEIGFLVLIKEGQPLDDLYLKSLNPLRKKLATAIRACLQNAESVTAYNKTVAYSDELIATGRQLEASKQDRQDALVALRQESANKQAILNAVPDSLLYLNRNGDILDLKAADITNPLFQSTPQPPDQTSLPYQALQKGNLSELLPPDIVELFLTNIEYAFQSGRLQAFEFELNTAQSRRVFETRLVVSDRQEVLSIIRDITQRREREEEIRILARFPAENPGPILRVDSDGTILYANPAGCPILRQWGSDIGQVIPSNWQQLVKRSFTENRNLYTETQCGDRVFSFVITPIAEAGYANLYGVDITARKRAEDAVNTALIKTEALYLASRAMTAIDDLPGLLQTVADRVTVALPADSVTLILLDVEKKIVRDMIKAGVGQQRIRDDIKFAELWDGLTGWVLRNLQPALSLKDKPDPRESEAVRRRRRKTEAGAIVVVPLQYGNALLGTLTAINRPEERNFDQTDVELMITLANQAAIAITNAQLVESLKESEERIRAIIDTAPDGIITIDTHDQIELFNPAAERIFGYNAAEVLGKKVDVLMPPPHKTKHAHYINSYLKTGQPKIIGNDRELVARRKDGTLFPINLSVGEVQLADQKLFTAIVQDITESKQAQETLAAVLNTVGEGIITIDAEGHIMMVNQEVQHIWGYSQDELLGQRVKMLMPKKYRRSHTAGLLRYQTTGVAHILDQRLELEGLRKDGAIFPLDIKIREIKIGKRVLFTAAVRDITELKKAQEALRQSEERHRSTLESMDDLVFVLDKDGRFIDYYQPPTRPELYIPPQVFLGAHFAEVLPPEIAAKLEQASQQIKDTGKVQQFDYSLSIDNRDLWFNAKISARRDSEGDFDGLAVAVRDVTERYELDKLRDDFVSTVSHELRTPLASIMGWTETLLTETPGPLTDHQRRFLTIVDDSSARLNTLIEEILTVSHIQRGTLKLHRQPFSPFDAVNSVAPMISTLANKKEITLMIANNLPADQTLTGDKNRLEQVLLNLLSNAVKFTPEAGQVWLRSTTDSDAWRVEVQDSGIGIPQADIPRLFDRFYRADNAADAKIQGTGLGLYICKAIVEAHGGQIGIDSEEGHGTTVQFSVPIS